MKMEIRDAMTAAQDRMAVMSSAEFAKQMIPHHEAAIRMAKAYLRSPEQEPTLTEMAKDIVSSQQSEIDTLKRWLKP